MRDILQQMIVFGVALGGTSLVLRGIGKICDSPTRSAVVHAEDEPWAMEESTREWYLKNPPGIDRDVLYFLGKEYEKADPETQSTRRSAYLEKRAGENREHLNILRRAADRKLNDPSFRLG